MSRSVRTAIVAVGSISLSVMSTMPAAAQTATAGQLLISEFRVRGTGAANDEFIEIYNNIGADHTVVAASGGGYGIAASDGASTRWDRRTRRTSSTRKAPGIPR